MPNHYTNTLIMFPGHDKTEESFDIPALLKAGRWGEKPLNRVVPMPAELEGTISPRDTPNWYDWQLQNRGCKWDAYDVVEPIELPGDCGAVQQTFCTAWGPPNELTRDALVAELQRDFGAAEVVWLGLDPYDCSVNVIGKWPQP